MAQRRKTRSVPQSQVPVYQLKITLWGIRPAIWRRLRVRGDINLGLLHCVLQVAMGWTNSHLHGFVINDERFTDVSITTTLPGEENPDRDEDKAILSEVLPKAKARFVYEYDYGDSWEHLLEVEKIDPPEPRPAPWVKCVDGRRACPPDDCGGVWGYADFLKAIKNPRHPEHESMLEWVGGVFHPEVFDIDHINRCLRLLKWPRTTISQLAGVLMVRDQPRGWVPKSVVERWEEQWGR